MVERVGLFRPIAKWTATPMRPGPAAEMVRKAFEQARAERPGATLLAVPEDVAPLEVSDEPLPVRQPVDAAPSAGQVARTVELLNGARAPLVLAGAGRRRDRCSAALLRFAERLNLRVAPAILQPLDSS